MKFIDYLNKYGYPFVFLLLLLLGLISLSLQQKPTLKEIDKAPTNVKVAVINYDLIMQTNPKMQEGFVEMNKYYQNMQSKFQNATPDNIKKLEEELKVKEREVFMPIKQEIDKNIKDEMKAKNIEFVFDKKALVVGGEDITINVLEKSGLTKEQLQEITKNIN